MEGMSGTGAGAGEAVLKEELGVETYEIIKELRTAIKQKGIQARMPFTIKIQ